MSRKKCRGGFVWVGSLRGLKVPKVSKVRKGGRCVGCGSRLTVANGSLDSLLCKNCFMVDLAEVESEDKTEDTFAEGRSVF